MNQTRNSGAIQQKREKNYLICPLKNGKILKERLKWHLSQEVKLRVHIVGKLEVPLLCLDGTLKIVRTETSNWKK